jgi:hypothetical protein
MPSPELVSALTGGTSTNTQLQQALKDICETDAVAQHCASVLSKYDTASKELEDEIIAAGQWEHDTPGHFSAPRGTVHKIDLMGIGTHEKLTVDTWYVVADTLLFESGNALNQITGKRPGNPKSINADCLLTFGTAEATAEANATIGYGKLISEIRTNDPSMFKKLGTYAARQYDKTKHITNDNVYIRGFLTPQHSTKAMPGSRFGLLTPELYAYEKVENWTDTGAAGLAYTLMLKALGRQRSQGTPYWNPFRAWFKANWPADAKSGSRPHALVEMIQVDMNAYLNGKNPPNLTALSPSDFSFSTKMVDVAKANKGSWAPNRTNRPA